MCYFSSVIIKKFYFVKLAHINILHINLSYSPNDQSLKFWWTNIENWWFWKTHLFWFGNFWFFFASSPFKSVTNYGVWDIPCIAMQGIVFPDCVLKNNNKKKNCEKKIKITDRKGFCSMITSSQFSNLATWQFGNLALYHDFQLKISTMVSVSTVQPLESLNMNRNFMEKRMYDT